MSDLKTKITALIAVVELTENKVGLETLKEIQEDIRWIPVAEKHPENDENVLLKINNKIVIGYYDIVENQFMYFTDSFEGFVEYACNVGEWRSFL